LRSGELSSAYRRPLMAFFLRHTDDRAEAEDLTQEVFVRILKGAPAATVQAPDAFVFTIAANLLLLATRFHLGFSSPVRG
jgi:RNA polymerase sigma-70 factor (ECF subfamily)